MSKSINAILLVLATVLAVPAASYAAGLGTITVRSALGQPLDAEIEVVSVQPGEDFQVRLASREAYAAAGVELSAALQGARFAIERRDGKTLIRVRTATPVNDPFFTVLVELQWGSGRLARQYTVLVDPAEYKTATAPAPQAAVTAPALAAVAPATAPVPSDTPAQTPKATAKAPTAAPARPPVVVAPPAPTGPAAVAAPAMAPATPASVATVAPQAAAAAPAPVTAPAAQVAVPTSAPAPAPAAQAAVPTPAPAPAPAAQAAVPTPAPTPAPAAQVFVAAPAPASPLAPAETIATPAPAQPVAAAPVPAATPPAPAPAATVAAPQAPAGLAQTPPAPTQLAAPASPTPVLPAQGLSKTQSNELSDTYRIKRGDTLGAIARKWKLEGVTYEQMLVGLFQTNRPVFIRDNINLIRAGATMFIPGREDVLAISALDATRQVRLHMAAFTRHRDNAVSTGAGSDRISQAQRGETVSRRVGVKKSTRAM